MCEKTNVDLECHGDNSSPTPEHFFLIKINKTLNDRFKPY